MNLLPNEIKKKIFNFIPIFLKKIVNKESYKKYILSYYPRNINDWKPFTVYDSDFRNCMNNMFNAIIKLKLVDWIINFNPGDRGYTYSTNDNVDKIDNEVNSDGHSGATFGYCLIIIEDIFKNSNYKKYLIEPENRKN
jgi:hypothetical protein